ncbi:MAG: branched-chain amino acid ABC transporter permease [Xanthobacteraceae bacterium]|nr:branched-chain amino acid ABC transporter permease [Xanthobacteraceae bacterium]MBX3550101.1 branched-chain amino acid ABC transporter permease [Xanthobacteraceae bacterium]MCW5673432.1 branched-chain amino acid ABC transporter permease [Xanthobacteraceae bacterium]
MSNNTMSASLKRYSVWVLAALVLLVLPLIFSSGASLTTMCLAGIMIIFALSYNMLLGQTGMLSFGHAVYYGLAAFVTAHTMNWLAKNGIPIPLPLVPIAGGIAGLFFGVVFGSVSTKRGGTAFAMISLGLAELVYSSSLILRSFFGGEEGISTDRTKLLRVFGYNFGPQLQVYYLIAAWTLLCVILMYALTRTPFGRMCNAVRENPERVEFVGYNPQFVRFIAFSLAGLFAGVAGSLAAINIELAQASFVGAAQSGAVLLAAYIGGVAFFVGPILGAILVTLLSIKLSDFSEIWLLYFGILFITIILFAPYGLSGLLMMHAQFWRGPMGARISRLLRLAGAYVIAAIPAIIMVAGAVLLIEMIHHVSQKTAEGPMMHFLRRPYLTINTASALPWIGALVALFAGFFAFRFTWQTVASAWHRALADMQRSGS